MPDWAPDVRTRLSSLRLSPSRESEIVDELLLHLDERYRELRAGGAEPEEAKRLALADFHNGNVLTQQMASLRQARVAPPITLGATSGHVLDDLWQDVRYAARVCWKQPAFAAAAVLTLALGIGATTAIVSVVYGVLLKPLPFAEADRLVTVRHVAPRGAGGNHGPATYLTYRENQTAFEAIGAWDTTEVSITGSANPERVQALLVSASTLPLLRVEPIVGRGFTSEDDAPGQPLRVIVTYGYWQRRFGGAGNVVGQPIAIDGRPGEVIGVFPPTFAFLRTNAAVVLPLPLDATALGASRGRIARALLAESVLLALAGGGVGVAVAQASTEALRAIAPSELPRVNDISTDATVLLFTLLVSLLSGALFGVFAVLRFGNPGSLTIKDGRSADDSPGRRRTREALVVGQLALALTLRIVSGLMIRTFLAMRQVDPGFTDPDHVQTFVIAIPPGLISDADQAARTHQRVAERVAQVPGVSSVGLSSSIAMDGEDNGNYLMVEGFTEPEGFLRELEQAVWAVDGNLPLAGVETLQEIRARSMAQTSFALVMLGIVVSAVLTSVTLLATYLPARRAARVNPIAALRMEV